MQKKDCIAMLLAGGQGSRLGALSESIAKPGVSFGGKYRIIDFSLSNCANSGIGTVGVLTQYRPYRLNRYIGTGAAWNLDERGGGVSILPPYATETGGSWYAGTADAIYQNLGYLETNDPRYVLILSGDHLYRMDYRKMLKAHKENKADLTVSVMEVPWEEAHRFGVLSADESGRITKFTEKSPHPESNLASMGVYIFTTEVLIDALKRDAADPNSEHDFGKNVIPMLLGEGKRLFNFKFAGFWKDVGTVASYHETNLQLLGSDPAFNLFAKDWPIMSNSPARPPHIIGRGGKVDNSLVANGCTILGEVRHSVISTNATVEAGAFVQDSILLPGARVGERSRIIRSIVGENTVVAAGTTLGDPDPDSKITVIGNERVVGKED